MNIGRSLIFSHMKKEDIPTPYYIVYEDAIRHNLDTIKDVATRAGVDIIMAFKANALWRTFDIFKEYGVRSTASSVNEMQLALDYLCDRVHTYCPAYTPATIDRFLNGSSHITFNSLGQYNQYAEHLKQFNVANPDRTVSAGLRVNPHCSVIETDLYNPSLPGSRFGVTKDDVADGLPDGIEGLHFHALCESTSYDLEKVLQAFENDFGHLLGKLKWVNMGGGHLMTRSDYDIDHLVSLLSDFKRRHPNLKVILEPGSAFTWQTGDLVTSVVDIVENDGVKTAIIDASFTCHMPDTLEMPYQPVIAESCEPSDSAVEYRLGGNSCLSGDYHGPWYFKKALVNGQQLTLKDMNHYTTVKTTMFNGIDHPAIVLKTLDGDYRYLRKFAYEDYRDRMC